MRCFRRLVFIGALVFQAGSSRAADYAVTPAYWDDIQEVLTNLGFAYDEIPETTLADYNAIKNYKAIFINCSGTASSNATPEALASLRQFVSAGGTVYASDWAFVFIDQGWPGMVTYYSSPRIAPAQIAPVNISNDGMRDYIGLPSLDLNFNLGAWVPIQDYKKPETQAYLVGAGGDSYVNGKAILVHFPSGSGNVIYTAFHNEAGLGAQAQQVLEYMVLIAILSSKANELARTLRDRGYLVVKENLNILTAGAASSALTISPSQVYDYAFAAAWNPTATLRVNATPPSAAAQQSQSATSPIILEIGGSSLGTWSYNLNLISAATSRHPYVLMAARRTPAYPKLDVVGYPNPFEADKHDVYVFDGLPARCTIRLFTLSGAPVKTIRKDDSLGTYFWYVDNDDGEKLAPGIYIYLIEADGQSARGKIAILR